MKRQKEDEDPNENRKKVKQNHKTAATEIKKTKDYDKMSPEEVEILNKQVEQNWSYENKTILAPMVRIGTLPMRKLVMKYGADMVYGQELIDHKVVLLKRRINPKNGYIEYTNEIVRRKQTFHKIEFTTYPGEKVAFQIGTNNSQRALLAAQNIIRDVRAIDINMGCPKHFSVHSGMGAGLLRNPENIRDILTTLTRNLNKPVTCKIRLLEDPHKTLELVKMIENCGVAAIGVHGRYTPDRPRHPARTHLIRQVVESINIPVIYNGDIFWHEQIQQAKDVTGCSSVMIARGAQWNASIFRKPEDGGRLPLWQVAKDYTEIAEELDNFFSNTKYAVSKMIEGTIALRKIKPIKIMANVMKSYEDLHILLREIKKQVILAPLAYPEKSAWSILSENKTESKNTEIPEN